MYKYTLAVTSPEYWSTIHNVLIVDSNEDGIPDRKVTCSDNKEHSPTRGTYWLTEEEAVGISTFGGDIRMSNKILHHGDTTTSFGFPENLVISFNTNNSERLRIGPLGQLGIAGANYG